MVRVHEVMSRELVTVETRQAVSVAAALMRIHEVGSVFVEYDGVLIGIVTETDIIRKVVSMHLQPEYTSVARIMSAPIVCIREDRPLFEAAGLMEEAGIRHVAVEDETGIVGILSVRDLLRPVAVDEF